MKTLIERNREYKNSIDTAYENAVSELRTVQIELTKRATDEWIARGGCKKCAGTGEYLSWCTLDGSCYDEFSACDECTDESRKVGRAPYAPNWGPVGSGGSRSRKDASTVAYEYAPDVVEPYKKKVKETKIPYDEIHHTVSRGDYVIVTGGRKVKIGTYGKVVGTKTNRFGYYNTSMSVGIITDDGSVVWTYDNNIELLAVLDGDAKVALENRFEENRQKFLESRRVA